MTIKKEQLLQLVGIAEPNVDSFSKITEGLSQQCFDITLNQSQFPRNIVIKYFNSPLNFRYEKCALSALESTNLTTKLIHCSPDINNEHLYIVMHKLPGITLAKAKLSINDKLKYSFELMKQFHHEMTSTFKRYDTSHPKHDKKHNSINHTFAEISPLNFNELFGKLISSLTLSNDSLININNRVSNCLASLSNVTNKNHSKEQVNSVICHGDLNFSNILLHEEKTRLIDFESISLMPVEYDIAMMLAVNELPISYHEKACLYYSSTLTHSEGVVTTINKHLIEHYYFLAALINGLWYLSEYHQSPSHSKFYSKAMAQFNLINIHIA